MECNTNPSEAKLSEFIFSTSNANAPGLASIAAHLLNNGYANTQSFLASPASLYVALEVLARGAKGETLNEIEGVLGNADSRRETCARLFEEHPEYVAEDYSLNIAASVWANKLTAPLCPDFPQAIANANGQAAEVEFGTPETKSQISAWLSKNTGGKFSTAPGFNAETLFTVISALHFKDNWMDPLDAEDEIVFNAPTGSRTITMMGGFSSDAKLLKTHEEIAVSWPMQSDAQAVFAMPNNAEEMDSFVKSGAAWKAISRCFEDEGATRPDGGIELYMPQLELKSEDPELEDTLHSLGVRKAFTPEAELGGITKADAMVSKVTQNTILKLDPNGADGAAYTTLVAVAACPTFPKTDPAIIELDRPFVFAVFSHSGAPLFVGTYMGD